MTPQNHRPAAARLAARLAPAVALFALATSGSAALAQAAPAAPAPSAAPAPVSAAKKQLVARLIQLQQPELELLAQQVAERPALQVMQQAGQALQRLPQERREAVARDVQADLRKYVEEAVPVLRARVGRLSQQLVTPVYEERFTEAELRQAIALLESPVLKKLQATGPELQKTVAERLFADTRAEVEPKFKAMLQTIESRLAPPAGTPGAAPAPAPAAPAAPAAPRN